MACAAAAAALAGCDTLAETEEVPATVRVIEMDKRAPERAAEPPPPIQGGSLLALSDGARAVVGDPDRHRLLIVELASGQISAEIELPSGAQPGRMAEDGAGRVHVVVRGTHELLTLDPASGEVLEERTVCGEPRGLAYEPTADALRLACADGTLWTFAVETGETLDKRFVAPDLRDVVVDGDGGAWLTTFHRAMVFHLHGEDSMEVLGALPSAQRQRVGEGGELEEHELEARAAWRAVGDGQGGVIVVHQRATTETIEIEPQGDGDDSHEPDEDGVLRQPMGTASSSVGSYGGGGMELGGGTPGGPACDAIVTSAVTLVGSDGTMRRSSAVGGAVLPVDVAISPDHASGSLGGSIVLASAGPRDPEAPEATFVFPETDFGPSQAFASVDVACPAGGDCENPGRSVRILSLGAIRVLPESFFAECLHGQTVASIREPAISVAFAQNQLLVQTREPARLYVVDPSRAAVIKTIELGGASVADTGHDLFHRDSGGGIACASCHLEGTEDGHVWKFTGLGKRRTQPLNVRLRGTQPFHWDGTLADLGPLMSEVFVGRMGGAPQDESRLDALSEWVLDLEPPAPIRPADDAAAQRGEALFRSAEVGCAACHSGPKLTNNTSVDVGTSKGALLQVPSLLGVGLRSPLMHDGCAKTLHDRFDPACGGGDEHGTTSHLSDDEVDDLVAYLETL